jgi:methylthioribose-1-phosphate isomerase
MRTVFWEDDQLKMIDQRILPGRFEVVAFKDHASVARAIRDMVVRGAPAIGAAAAFGLALAGYESTAASSRALLNNLRAAADTLKAARPTAVNLAWAVDKVMWVAEKLKDERSPDELRQLVLSAAQYIADEDVEINKRMAEHGAALINDGDTIIHHFGADRVAANGDVANKIGTYMLALAAHDNGVPVYSVVPTSTVDLSLAHGGLIPIEERDPEEVLGIEFHGERVAPIEAKARNIAFDVTPNRLITGIVTENGVVYPPFDVNLKKTVLGK